MLWAAAAAGLAAGILLGLGAAGRRRRRQAKMLSFIAHEVNTPLTSMQMTVVNLRQGAFGDVPKPYEPWLELLEGEIVRLGRLVGDMRDYVKLEMHRELPLAAESVNLAAVIEEALSAQRDAFRRADVPLEISIAPGLPPVRADRDRAMRAVSACLGHARKFRVSGPIELTAGADGGGAAVRVAYEGYPQHAEQMRGALEIYHPIEASASEALAGVGVGLGLHHAIALRQGARLRVELPGGGRVAVYVHLPAETA